MKTDIHTSTWLSGIALPPAREALSGSVETDVVVVGGGLVGTLSAYLLAKAGKKVIVLEKKDITNSTTAWTTAWLNAVIDTDFSDLVNMYTAPGAKKIWASGMEAIDLIEKIVTEEHIDCDFVRVSHWRYATSEKEMANLKREHGAIAKAGLVSILHDNATLSFPNTGSLEIQHQAKFHPIKFLIRLREAALKYGAFFYDNTEAVGIAGDTSVVVTTKEGKVTAGYLVIATYAPFNKPKELFAHTGMYVSYVLEVRVPKNIIPEGLYEDERNPYHYFRIDHGIDFDRMILGGEDHRREISISKEKNFRALKEYLVKLLPGVKYEIVHEWSGPILETIDGLPYIGAYSKQYPKALVATGFSGNGMTYSAIAAQILTDIILKKENPYTELYLASRKTKLSNFLRKALDFGAEFFGGAVKNFFK